MHALISQNSEGEELWRVKEPMQLRLSERTTLALLIKLYDIWFCFVHQSQGKAKPASSLWPL